MSDQRERDRAQKLLTDLAAIARDWAQPPNTHIFQKALIDIAAHRVRGSLARC
jgi:hypothetical protein